MGNLMVIQVSVEKIDQHMEFQWVLQSQPIHSGELIVQVSYYRGCKRVCI